MTEKEKCQKETDEAYMRRCLQTARGGLLRARPNPSVGAVIVSADGRIIGEGHTLPYGGPHAEVNAFASVKAEDEKLLTDATMYVSLEPCSHYGHTPPCCDLIIKKGIRRVVCGCIDPFAKVQGRGIERMREAGIDVTVGVLEDECIESNIRFMTFNKLKRPFIILKWCQTANGLIDDNFKPTRLSTPLTTMLSHKLRAENEAILVGHTTEVRDHPKLTTREWYGPNPERIVLTRETTIDDILKKLYDEKKQSLIVEGGRLTLQSFIDRDLWDVIRVETALDKTFTDGTRAPQLPENTEAVKTDFYGRNLIQIFRKK